jgi:hypothetical protein
MTDLDDIRRQLRNLRVYAVLCTLVTAALLLMGAKSGERADRFSTLRAERIEIVDADGKVRMLLTGPQKMPGPGGPHDYRPNARKFVAPAIIFYDETEHEYGGLVPRAKTGDTSMTAMVFDYGKTEAGGFFTQQKDDGSGFAGLIINDPSPPAMSQAEAMNMNWNRIRISNPGKNAEIVLSDTKGKGRILLRVTNDDQAYLEILDADGKAVFRAPPAAP